MPFCDCAYTHPVHAYPVAGHGDWHTGLVWHSTYRHKTDRLKSDINDQTEIIRQQTETIDNLHKANSDLNTSIIQLQTSIEAYESQVAAYEREKSKREQEIMQVKMENATITEANTSTSIRNEMQKIKQLMSDLQNTDNTSNTTQRKCNELQKHLILYIFYGEVAGIFGARLSLSDFIYFYNCTDDLKKMMTVDDYSEFDEKIRRILKLNFQKLFTPYRKT